MWSRIQIRIFCFSDSYVFFGIRMWFLRISKKANAFQKSRKIEEYSRYTPSYCLISFLMFSIRPKFSYFIIEVIPEGFFCPGPEAHLENLVVVAHFPHVIEDVLNYFVRWEWPRLLSVVDVALDQENLLFFDIIGSVCVGVKTYGGWGWGRKKVFEWDPAQGAFRWSGAVVVL